MDRQLLRSILLNVEKPGRYSGGEYNAVSLKMNDASLGSQVRVALSFPDMYEIGMSNLAIKILYGMLNQIEGTVCERVFAPASDFEKELRQNSLPLYTLESRTPLHEMDILGFSIGYELTFTNMLAIMDLGGLPLRSRQREDGQTDNTSYPIVIAGGPAITNPYPYAHHIDAIFIGEAEAVLPSVFKDIVTIKEDVNRAVPERAEARAELRSRTMERLRAEPSVWMPGSRKTIKRSIWTGFGEVKDMVSRFPVQNIKTVQDHGTIEIMRGCPNGCRFCHAGMYYRPVREKPLADIIKEASQWIYDLGFREITLSSLSSCDYSRIGELVTLLSERYSSEGISFAFPSLRINSFTLSLLTEISAVRKSGLTFAIETPHPQWQASLNKEATKERVIEIIREAKEKGWRVAKFYFMIGLPVADGSIPAAEEEIAEIVAFIREVRDAVSIQLNINLGTFIPKPHTPFQWSPQLPLEESEYRLKAVKAAIKGNRIKASYHSPFLSFLEGLISRGDERVGLLVEEAFRAGARFDAWEEQVREDIWNNVFNKTGFDVAAVVSTPRAIEEPLPWHDVSIGVSQAYLEKEFMKSRERIKTNTCGSPCAHYCGVCGNETGCSRAGPQSFSENEQKESPDESQNEVKKILFSYKKKGPAIFLSHLDTVGIVERAFQRAGIPIQFSQGFNPKPKLEFAHPLSLGIESEDEIASALIVGLLSEEEIKERINGSLPAGFRVSSLSFIHTRTRPKKDGQTPPKVPSLMAVYGGSFYRITPVDLIDQTDKVNKLISFLKKNTEAVESCTITESTSSDCTVFIKYTGKKSGNIMHLLKLFSAEDSQLDSPLLSWNVVRVKTTAGEERQRYFDYFT